MKNKELPAGILAFHTDYFDNNKEDILRDLLTRRRIHRIWELREHGDDEYELELSLFRPHYNGAEGYWTSTESDWLVATFREKVPECDRYGYRGPFSTMDLRDTWEWKGADSGLGIPL